MIQQFITQSGAKTLRIFFAGWGSDEKLFGKIPSGDFDLLLCYDYRTLDFNYSLITDYERIEVYGWSFGVWVAEVTMSGRKVDFSRAINGTAEPISDENGIPVAIFEGTLSTFSPQTLSKFRRRMCGTSDGVKAFLALEPRRSVEELREELAKLQEFVNKISKKGFTWDEAVVGLNDNIIPTANQLNFWKDHKNVTTTPSAHFSIELFEQYLYE